MDKILTVAVLGVGSRGTEYSRLMLYKPEQFKIVSACDYNKEQMIKYRKFVDILDENVFYDENEFLKEKRADVLMIATYDRSHFKECIKALKLGYNVILEKPISDSREEINELLKVQKETGGIVAVCHEMRYITALKRIYDECRKGTIGKILGVDQLERVAYWHQAQAYVRIGWRNTEIAHPMILAKCCHDLDYIYYLVGSPCKSVSSLGGLTYFRKENAPQDSTEYCVDCPYVDSCTYSAKRIYIDMWKADGCPKFVWPYNKVSLNNPTTEEDLKEGIKHSNFGKCVFKCDNNVVDHQMVQMEFENGVIASLKMMFGDGPEGRRIDVFGTLGEIVCDLQSGILQIRKYGEKALNVDLNESNESGFGHGDGDTNFVFNMYDIFTGTSNGYTSLEDSVESHLMGIAAEESRLNNGKLTLVHK